MKYTDLEKTIKNNRVSHSYIFNKEQNAEEYAKKFAEILKTKTQGYQELMYISKKEDKSEITVDQIRNMQEKMLVKPINNGIQVYIIEKADLMNTSAQNCLLKTLEEPNEYVIIILCVSNVNKLLKTIQSRCIKVDIESDNLKTIELEDEQKDEISDFLINLEMSGISNVVDYQAIFEKYKLKIKEVIEYISTWYRDYMIYNKTGDDKMLINQDKKDYIVNNSKNFKEEQLINIFDVINLISSAININANYQMLIDNLVIGIWRCINDKSCRSTI